jgi:hypothetical protein
MNSKKSLINLKKSSAWSEQQVCSFLATSTIPLRIATTTGSYPTLCSVWYMFDERQGDLLCVSHENSQLVADLMANQKCSFEIAPNEPPYCGVRGKAMVTLSKDYALETLTTLIPRYLGNAESRLAKWLIGRSAEEYVIRLRPVQMTSWDYSERMS